jgi:putative acetyltransferase
MRVEYGRSFAVNPTEQASCSMQRVQVWQRVGFAAARSLPCGHGKWTNGLQDALLLSTIFMAPNDIEIRPDNLRGAPTLQLIARHLRGMHENSPAESVHAFDIDKLRNPAVTFWSAWVNDEIAGCGALKRIDDERGEVKSMRVADAFLGQGIGRTVLIHIISEARARGMRSLWLETGSATAFAPALRLYESAGFIRCGPFGDYCNDPFSIFMTLIMER